MSTLCIISFIICEIFAFNGALLLFLGIKESSNVFAFRLCVIAGIIYLAIGGIPFFFL